MSTESPRPVHSASKGFGCLGAAIFLSLSLTFFGIGLFTFGVGWIFHSVSQANWKWETTVPGLDEVVLRGDAKHKDLEKAPRIAVIHINGVLVEGGIDKAIDELDMALADDRVKGIVVRIDSPGGTLTAAHTLHQKIQSFVKTQNNGKPKVAVGSIGPIAASGGYYLAMACHPLISEVHSQTGSIGVYVSFPNVEGLAKQWGVASTMVKQGDIKDSGSLFRAPTPKEKQVWQDLVDEGYKAFVETIEDSRPALKGKLLEPMKMKSLRAGPVGADGPAEYSRYRADGGVWTAKQAKEAGLIDDFGDLEDAIDRALTLAGLDDDALVVEYDRPPNLVDSLLGRDRHRHDPIFEIPTFEKALATLGSGPRIWCLAPGFETEGAQALLKAQLQKTGKLTRKTGKSKP